MSRVGMVTMPELPSLACPYCGAAGPTDPTWAAAAATLWEWCGVKIIEGGQVQGLLLLAPMEEPGHAEVKRLWVHPEVVGRGHGRRLVQAAAAGLLTQKTHEITACGSREHLRCEAPPRDFLKAIGFVRSLEDRLWHLDLDRTVAAERGVRTVVERIIDSLRPITPPNPAGGAVGRNER